MTSRLLFLIAFLFCCNLVHGQDLNYSNIDNSLIEDLEQSGKTYFDIYVILEDKVDVEALDRQLTAARVSPKVRSKTVLSTLQAKAKASQPLLLEEMSKNKNIINQTIKPYWIANVIFFTATKRAIAEMSNDVRIQYIGLDGELSLEESVDEGPATVLPDSVEIGLDAINVRPMWEMGYTGYGQLALVADTGIDPTHSAFSNRYRGYTNGDEEAWFAYEDQGKSPFQCNDHGSHVLGILLGLDNSTNDTIGVAFEAQWMGSANLCGGGTQSNIGTFEWSTNPDGNLDTVDDMADVINNSWWDPSVSGADCNSIYVDVLIALEAAGVAVVFSAGNGGNAGNGDESTITSPKNINVDLVNTFAVGNVDANIDEILIAGSSSRGPSICGGEGALLIKPEVSAPGSRVRSSVLDNEYGFKTGTSMAAPHVSGSIIILKQAFPNATSKDLKMALYQSCRDLGEVGEDNTYGAGIIDVYAAYQYMIAQGFEPVPAVSSENDVMALNIETDRIECDGALTGAFRFLNNSRDTLYSVNIDVFIDGALVEDLSTQWTGILMPNEIETISLDRSTISEGIHNIEVVLSQPNGMNEERILNNSTRRDVLFSNEMQLARIQIEDQTTCNESSTLVKTDFEGDGIVRWYDRLDGGNLIGEGTQFALSVPDGQTTIYGDLTRINRSGKTQTSPADLVFEAGRGEGIRFNVNAPVRITSFDFYAEQSGNIFIAVESGVNNDITQIDSELIRSDGSGWQTAEVGINLTPGIGYRMLYKDGTVDFGRANVELDFPYIDSDGNIEVTGDEAGQRGEYKFFFNLKMEFPDFCGRIPVEINASTTTEEAPVAVFETDISLVDFNNNQAINFSNNSLNGVSYFWDFGDGNTSTEEEPSHTYAETGIYYASLLVRSPGGCDDAFVQRIEIVANEGSVSTQDVVSVNSFLLAPNPVSNRIDFVTGSPVEVDEIKLYNSAGQLLNVYPIHSRVARHSLNVNDLTSGLYYFVIQTAGGIETHKVVKL